MPKREARVKFLNFEKLDNSIFAVMKPAAEELASLIAERIKDEVPVGEGKLRDTVNVAAAQRTKNTFHIQIGVGDDEVKYAFAVWKGLDPEIYSVSPNTQPQMIFSIDKWPQYDGRWGKRDVFVFSKTLRNYIPENDFIGRALAGIEGLAQLTFRKNIKIVFGRAR